MAIQQSVQIDLVLVGDGAATQFTYAFNKLFTAGNSQEPAMFASPTTIPTGASVQGTTGSLGTATASIDGFGNLIINFAVAPASGATGIVSVILTFNSGTLAGTTAAWTSATALNTTWTLPLNGSNSVSVGFVVSGTITGGAITFQVSQDGANWLPIQGSIADGYTALTGWTNGVGNRAVQFDTAGYAYLRLILNPVITGTGTVTFIFQASNAVTEPVPTVGQANGANLHVTIDDAAGNATTMNVLSSIALATTGAAAYTTTRKLVTYRAVCRLAARPYALSNAFGAAGRKQYVTIFHGAGAAKNVTLRHVWVACESASAASITMADLVRLTNATTPATGNPAITPTPSNPGDAAAEATVLCLPTTAGTEGAVHSTHEWDLGLTSSASTVNPPPGLQWVDLLAVGPTNGPDFEGKNPIMRAANAEGWAIIFDCSAAATIKGYVVVEFTEQ